MLEQLLNQFNLYIWAKDKSSRYIYVNENYAKAAGMDSPCQMIGKTDDEMPWRNFADEIKHGDQAVMNGATRINSMERTNTIDGVRDILVSEMRFVDRNGDILGVKGSLVDITDLKLLKQPGYYDEVNQRYYLGIKELGDVYLTIREMEVFKMVLKGWTAARIATTMNLSAKTVETYIVYIRRKFGAETKSELVAAAVQYGLTHLIDE